MALVEHGTPGQVSPYVLDRASPITGFGKHNRLLVFFDEVAGIIEIREDELGLPWSTERERQHAACRTFQRMHPMGTRLVFQHSDSFPDGTEVMHRYQVEADAPPASN